MLGFAGVNLALKRIGGRTSEVETGVRKIGTRPRPYSRLYLRLCVGGGCKSILTTQAWEEADGATQCRAEELQDP